MRDTNAIRHSTYGKRRGAFKFGTFDLETDGLAGDFIIAGTYDQDSGFQSFLSMPDLLQYLTSRSDLQWFAHNGARYDFGYFLTEDSRQWILDNDWTLRVMQSRTQAIGMTLEKEIPGKKKPLRISFKDFFRFFPQRLSKLTKLFNTEHGKLENTVDFENGEVFDPQNSDHMMYLEHDCRGLYEVIEKFSELLWEHYGVPVGWTAPGTAMNAWQKTIPKDHAYYKLCKTKRDFFREGYYGGMVQVRYSEFPKSFNGIPQENIHADYYDVNSMYPAQMLKGVPCGTPSRTKQYEPGKPGFYRVRAHVPDTAFPMIPYRDKTGTKWPIGIFETVLTSLEIEFGQKQGITFDIQDGYVFPGIEQPFDKFIQKCRELRLKYRKTPLEMLAKLMQNSLYGKFGSSETTRALYFGKKAPESSRFFLDIETGMIIDGAYEVEENLDVGYLQPHWAAWITANARICLSEQIIKLGERFVYCDTDSLTVISNGWTTPPFELSETEYGAYKHEGRIEEWYCAGPKTYAARFGADWSCKAKGVHTQKVTWRMVQKASRGEKIPVKMGTMTSLPVLIKNDSHGPKYIHLERTLTTPENVLGFRWFNGKFHPIKIFA
jgi:hypothetical protein